MIGIFAIHEEVLVEQSAVLQGFAADKHTGSGYYLDRGGLVLVEVPHVVPTECVTLREQGIEARHFAEGSEGCWYAPTRLKGEAAVLVQHPHTRCAHLGMGVEQRDAVAEKVFVDKCIGIEQHHVFAFCAS